MYIVITAVALAVVIEVCGSKRYTRELFVVSIKVCACGSLTLASSSTHMVHDNIYEYPGER